MRWFLLFALTTIAAGFDFDAEIAKWRQEREARLKAPDGWLSVAGLFWLKPGRNTVGSASSAAVHLPSRAPAQVGWFTLDNNIVKFDAAPGASVTINGKSVKSAGLKSDADGEPDVVEVEGLKLYVIRRADRLGIRLKDSESKFRKDFRKLRWFPARRDWLINGKFIPYPEPRRMKFDSQTGDKQEYTSPGYVEFEHGGTKLRLTPVLDDGRLFFIFRDRTAGKTTYPAARFLYADLPVNGRVTLDFNKAYNPPCVFTPYATCPLPPLENRLAIPVDAGELMYSGDH